MDSFGQVPVSDTNGASIGDEMWSMLGLGAVDERLYRMLLQAPGQELSAVIESSGLSAQDVGASCEVLLGLRLVRRARGRIEALEPRAALSALARQRQDVLDQVGSVAHDLGVTFGAARLRADPHSLFQVLRGADEIAQRHLELVQAAMSSICVVAVPPFVTGSDSSTGAVIRAALSRGVRIRVVYDAAILQDADAFTALSEGSVDGEETRTVSGVSTRFIIIDEGTTMLPIISEPDRSDASAIVVARSEITQALLELFEYHWSRGQPLTTRRSPALDDDLDMALLELLSGGLTDQVIAHRLRCSERTLRRRINALLRHFGVSNRFQLGATAVRRGWL